MQNSHQNGRKNFKKCKNEREKGENILYNENEVMHMMPEQVKELARKVMKQKAEAQDIEVKSAHQGCPKRLYDTLSSFSNQDGGGVILFGLDEAQDFAPVGVYDLQDLQKRVTEQCQQMEPPVRALFSIAECDGKPILSAEIPGLDYAERPCYYRGAGRVKGSYVRTGDADLPMTDYEIYSYEAFRHRVKDDERVIERSTVEALDADLVTAYVEEKKKNHPKFAKLPLPVMLDMLNVTHQGKPTLAALMNFGLYPQGYVPQLSITAISVMGLAIGEGDDEEIRFQDNERIEGNLDAMMTGAMDFCRRNMKVRTVIDSESGRRKDRTEYPLVAVREAILNALIHRDYSPYTEGTPIQIDFFKNRLEIHSPGGLYGRMTVEELGKARPDLRNPTLAVMAETMTESENRYSGIPTMRRAMEEAGLPAPVFENRRGEFVVTFFNGEDTEEEVEDTLSPSEKILLFCRKPRTKQEIATFLHIRTVTYAMSRYIKPLLKEGKLQVQPSSAAGELKYISAAK